MEIIEKLTENVEIILPTKGILEKLELAQEEQRPLRIKLGFDPTAPDLHLGHAVVLKKLKQFQDLGHQIVILVGSFTARIGDPTGKNKSRKPLSLDDVQTNAQTYINQLSKVIDVDKAQIVFNSDWLDHLPFTEVIRLLSNVTVAQLMHRNDFNKRFTENTPIAMHELVYPILQGFDSLKINCDIEMGGTDQLFNCTMGRQLQESFNLPAQAIMCLPLLRGLDGKEKMSKSLNNIIGLTDHPNDMFGKTMSIPDHLIEEFLRLTTDFTILEREEIMMRLSSGENPIHSKKSIAKNIVEQYHGKELAESAQAFFEQQFQQKHFFDKVFTPISIKANPTYQKENSLLNICFRLAENQSKSAIRRLIESGAIQVDNKKETDPEFLIKPTKNMKIRVGKKNYFEFND
ncbi:tyrosine--tRNA ligase [Sphingobacterium sp. LRF_L2]|uniref:tyrosine--tRNA ligase n=1 Tax=Sphingobacterium sp. LRF_L2 TaxID=3369421 RepID=UPI003F5EFF31